MMISSEIVQTIADQVKLQGVGEDVIQQLRLQYPKIHFTYCMDDDVCGPNPALEADGFNLYFIDGREHCLAFTNDNEIATGIVVAEVIDDE